MTETTEFIYKRTPRGLVLDPVTVQVQPPTKVVHEVDEVKFLNQNPDSIGPPIEDPRSYVGLEASTQMPLGNTYTLQLPVAQGNIGEVLENDGTGQLEWKVGGGSGDVVYTGVNPVPTTRQFAVYDGTTGTEIKDSGYTAPAPASGIVGDVLTLNTPTDAVWTAPIVGGVQGIPPSLPGNLPQFDNLVADQISDSGVKASEVILNPSGVPLVGGTLAQFDTGPSTITDSGIPVASVGTVIGVPATTIGNLSEWTDATATQIGDSVVVAAEVVQNPSGVGVNGNLAQFGATPEQITDSGIVVADVGDVKSSSIPSVDSRIALFDGITGKIIKESTVGIDEADIQNVRWVNTSGSLMAPGVGAAALSNCFFGRLAGANTSVGGANFQNTSVGTGSFTAPSGAWGTTNNTAIGRSSLAACNGRSNTAIGALSLFSLDSTSNFNGNGNCAFGHQALYNLGTDANLNIAIGQQVGSNYTAAETNNLLIGSNLTGVAAESNTTRIGQGQTRCFVEGIVGNASTPTYENVMIDPATNQLTTSGVVEESSFGQMYFNGNTGTQTPIAAVNTWVTVAGPGGYSSTPSPDFTYTTVGNVTTMQYTGTDTIRLSCGAAFCWESASGTSDDATIAIHIDTGGGFVPVQASIQNSKLDNNNFGYPRNGSCRCIFSLSTGHSIAIRVQNNNNTANILVLSLSFDCFEI